MSNPQNPLDRAPEDNEEKLAANQEPAAPAPTPAEDPIHTPDPAARNEPPTSSTSTPQGTPQGGAGIRSTTPELTQADRERLAAFLEKVFGDAGSDPEDDSSALIDLVKRESEVRARRNQVWVEEVEDEAYRAH